MALPASAANGHEGFMQWRDSSKANARAVGAARQVLSSTQRSTRPLTRQTYRALLHMDCSQHGQEAQVGTYQPARHESLSGDYGAFHGTSGTLHDAQGAENLNTVAAFNANGFDEFNDEVGDDMIDPPEGKAPYVHHSLTENNIFTSGKGGNMRRSTNDVHVMGGLDSDCRASCNFPPLSRVHNQAIFVENGKGHGWSSGAVALPPCTVERIGQRTVESGGNAWSLEELVVMLLNMETRLEKTRGNDCYVDQRAGHYRRPIAKFTRCPTIDPSSRQTWSPQSAPAPHAAEEEVRGIRGQGRLQERTATSTHGGMLRGEENSAFGNTEYDLPDKDEYQQNEEGLVLNPNTELLVDDTPTRQTDVGRCRFQRHAQASRDRKAGRRISQGLPLYLLAVDPYTQIPYGDGLFQWKKELMLLIKKLDPTVGCIKRQPLHALREISEWIQESWEYSNPIKFEFVREVIGQGITLTRADLQRRIRVKENKSEDVSNRTWQFLTLDLSNLATTQKAKNCCKANASRKNFGRTGPSGEVGVR